MDICIHLRRYSGSALNCDRGILKSADLYHAVRVLVRLPLSCQLRRPVRMLIKESHVDVQSSQTPMRIFLFEPIIPSGHKARFPGLLVFTEIYQVTAPITRFCRQLAGHGFIVASCSSYHEFMGPEPLAYDDNGEPPLPSLSSGYLGRRC